MVWTAPMTAVAGSVFTAAQFNQYVRDNLLQTAPALASAAGQYFVATGLNAIAARACADAIISTSETTASTSYTDLTTPGPAVTLTTGTSVLVCLYAAMFNSGANNSLMSYAVSGATTHAEADNLAIANNGTAGIRYGNCIRFSGLTPGSNTFTCRYKVNAGTGTFVDRRILVIPF